MAEDSYDRIIKLIRETVIMLCKNGVHFDCQLRVQGLIGVTIDEGTVFLVHMNDCVMEDGRSSADTRKSVQSSVVAEASSRQLHADVVSEPNEAEAHQWSKTLEAGASPYSHVKQERDADVHVESQSAAGSPASLTASLSFLQQNKFWDPIKDDDISIESTSDKTSVGSTSAASAVWNLYPYSVLSAADQSADRSARDMSQMAKTPVNYAPVHSATSRYSESLNVKPEYGQMGVTHCLSTPKYQSSRIGGGQRHNMAPHTIPRPSWHVPHSSEPRQQFATSQQPTAFQCTSVNTRPRAKRGRPRKTIDVPVTAQFGPTVDDDASKWDMVKVTKFACKLCGQTFNHQPNLFRHQITAHGRQKKTRGRAVPRPL